MADVPLTLFRHILRHTLRHSRDLPDQPGIARRCRDLPIDPGIQIMVVFFQQLIIQVQPRRIQPAQVAMSKS